MKQGTKFYFYLFSFVEIGEQIKNEDENICTKKQQGIKFVFLKDEKKNTQKKERTKFLFAFVKIDDQIKSDDEKYTEEKNRVLILLFVFCQN